LRRRGEIDETGSGHKEGKQKESRPTMHDSSTGFVEKGGPPGLG
jgi:hypothetical protein